MPDNEREPNTRTTGVNAVARAIEILRVLGESTEDLTLSYIAEASGLPRSTVHRIVQTLQEANFVTPDNGKTGVRLGQEFARLATISRNRIVPVVRPFLEELSHALHQGASLAVLDGRSIRFLDQAVSGAGLRAISLVGSTFPAHCTANGKVLLAALPNSAVRSLLPKTLQGLTDNTITNRDELIAELKEIRSSGVAYDREEHQEGICAVGALITDAADNRAAITVAVPARDFEENEEAISSAVRTAAKRITAALSLQD